MFGKNQFFSIRANGHPGLDILSVSQAVSRLTLNTEFTHYRSISSSKPDENKNNRYENESVIEDSGGQDTMGELIGRQNYHQFTETIPVQNERRTNKRENLKLMLKNGDYFTEEELLDADDRKEEMDVDFNKSVKWNYSENNNFSKTIDKHTGLFSNFEEYIDFQCTNRKSIFNGMSSFDDSAFQKWKRNSCFPKSNGVHKKSIGDYKMRRKYPGIYWRNLLPGEQTLKEKFLKMKCRCCTSSQK